MQVFPKPIVLTIKPCIDAMHSVYIKARLGVGEIIALRKTHISAIVVIQT